MTTTQPRHMRGLANVGTATTRRIRSRSPDRSSAYLNMFLLGKERDRLVQSLAHIERKRQLMLRRVAAIGRDVEKLDRIARDEGRVAGGLGNDGDAASRARPSPGRWNTMQVEY